MIYTARRNDKLLFWLWAMLQINKQECFSVQVDFYKMFESAWGSPSIHQVFNSIHSPEGTVLSGYFIPKLAQFSTSSTAMCYITININTVIKNYINSQWLCPSRLINSLYILINKTEPIISINTELELLHILVKCCQHRKVANGQSWAFPKMSECVLLLLILVWFIKNVH